MKKPALPTSLTLEVTLGEAQLKIIAEHAAQMLGRENRNPMTVAEFARAAGVSYPTVSAWVKAGIIRKSPIPGDTRIPCSELDRYREGK